MDEGMVWFYERVQACATVHTPGRERHTREGQDMMLHPRTTPKREAKRCNVWECVNWVKVIVQRLSDEKDRISSGRTRYPDRAEQHRIRTTAYSSSGVCRNGICIDRRHILSTGQDWILIT